MLGFNVSLGMDVILSALGDCFPCTVLQFLAFMIYDCLMYIVLYFFLSSLGLVEERDVDQGVLPYRTFILK